MTPFSLEAEHALLGALMYDGAEVMSRLECEVKPEHFYRQDHGRIYSTIRKLIDGGKTADFISVSDSLEQSGELQAVGGMAYLSDLASSAYSTAGAKRHAEIIIEKASIRSLLALSSQIQELVSEPGIATQDKINEAQKLVMGLSDREAVGSSDPKTMDELLPGYLESVGARWENSGGGMDTGFPDLDRRLNGGVVEGSFVILAARPAMGKTSAALQVAHHFADRGRSALVLSQEMQNHQLIDRVASFVGRVPLGNLLRGEMDDDQHAKYGYAISQLRGIPLNLDEQGSLKLEEVRRKARKVKAKHGLSLIVIDYLQLMVGDGENRTQELSKITAGLKSLAKELKCCVMALSQLNRQLESRSNKRPTMADLRESGSIEQDADVILALYRDEYYNEDSPHKGLAELLVLKNRQGATGGFVPMTFQGEYTRFDSMAGAWPVEYQDKPRKSRGFG